MNREIKRRGYLRSKHVATGVLIGKRFGKLTITRVFTEDAVRIPARARTEAA